MEFISLSQAFEQWQELALPRIPHDDVPMMSESWNDYTDSLTKDGTLSPLQYHYAPAYDDPMPGQGSTYDPLADDREFIAESMGVAIDSTRTESRPDADQWDAGASHWNVTVTRGSKSFTVPYSMGSAHKGAPKLCSVLYCLLLDSGCSRESFDAFCADIGADTDSRRAFAQWEACKATAANMARLFTADELDGMRDLWRDY